MAEATKLLEELKISGAEAAIKEVVDVLKQKIADQRLQLALKKFESVKITKSMYYSHINSY